jgi:hypothetical protein
MSELDALAIVAELAAAFEAEGEPMPEHICVDDDGDLYVSDNPYVRNNLPLHNQFDHAWSYIGARHPTNTGMVTFYSPSNHTSVLSQRGTLTDVAAAVAKDWKEYRQRRPRERA